MVLQGTSIKVGQHSRFVLFVCMAWTGAAGATGMADNSMTGLLLHIGEHNKICCVIWGNTNSFGNVILTMQTSFSLWNYMNYSSLYHKYEGLWSAALAAMGATHHHRACHITWGDYWRKDMNFETNCYFPKAQWYLVERVPVQLTDSRSRYNCELVNQFKTGSGCPVFRTMISERVARLQFEGACLYSISHFK